MAHELYFGFTPVFFPRHSSHSSGLKKFPDFSLTLPVFFFTIFPIFFLMFCFSYLKTWVILGNNTQLNQISLKNNKQYLSEIPWIFRYFVRFSLTFPVCSKFPDFSLTVKCDVKRYIYAKWDLAHARWEDEPPKWFFTPWYFFLLNDFYQVYQYFKLFYFSFKF